MHFIKDGKKYTIKPPSQKTDRNGNVVEVQGAIHGRAALADRYTKIRQERATAVRERRDRIFKLSDDAKVLERAGIESASGMALVPGFNLEEYSQLSSVQEKFEYMDKFRDDVLFNRTEEQAEEFLICMKTLTSPRNLDSVLLR